jgi:hypothetical protein
MNCPNNTPIVGNLQIIGINRGTSLRLKAQRLDANGDPILVKAEEIYFIVKKRWTDTQALITKDLSDMEFDEFGYYHFTIGPTDTEKIPYGQYVWDFTAVDADDTYRAKPAHGYFIIGNSAGWIINETES